MDTKTLQNAAIALHEELAAKRQESTDKMKVIFERNKTIKGWDAELDKVKTENARYLAKTQSKLDAKTQECAEAQSQLDAITQSLDHNIRVLKDLNEKREKAGKESDKKFQKLEKRYQLKHQFRNNFAHVIVADALVGSEIYKRVSDLHPTHLTRRHIASLASTTAATLYDETNRIRQIDQGDRTKMDGVQAVTNVVIDGICRYLGMRAVSGVRSAINYVNVKKEDSINVTANNNAINFEKIVVMVIAATAGTICKDIADEKLFQ